ncbi:MAG: AAA family ATPase, partial [Desulfamplus sp.]|nr:AAA family ATPase [Desulfamplus sp.]
KETSEPLFDNELKSLPDKIDEPPFDNELKSLPDKTDEPLFDNELKSPEESLHDKPPESSADKVNKKDVLWKKPVYSDSHIYRIDPAVVAANRGVCINPNSEEIQRYKILKTRIQQHLGVKSLNTIMITSPHKREGKTVNAINMAFTFARGMNQTVLLVDCDFTGQDVHKYLGIDSRVSLIDYFIEGTPINELIIWTGIDKLTIISGNRTLVDGSEILSSKPMEELIQEMKHRYDDRYILFDAPPVLEHAEAISMAPMVDGIIMVVEAGVTSKKDVQRSLSMLPKEKIIGLLLNKRV